MGRTIPIIAMTANAFSEDVKDCLDAGMDAPAAKPLDTAVLERTLRSLLARDFRTKESYQEIQIAPMRQRPHGGTACQKSLAEFAALAANKIQFILWRGVYTTQNTL